MSFGNNGAVSTISQINHGGQYLADVAGLSIKPYVDFEDGLPMGLIVQLKAGVLSALDGTADAVIAGVSKFDMSRTIEEGAVYTSNALVHYDLVNVIEMGIVSIPLATGAAPTEKAPVYYINDGADAGKVTQDSGATNAVLLQYAEFYREVKEDAIWQIRLR